MGNNDAFPMFSDAEMAGRHARVRAEMARAGLEAVIVYGHTGMGTSVGQVNLQYLARYAAVIETYLVLPAVGEPTLFLAVPFHILNAKTISYVQDIRSGDALGNVIARIRDLKLERGKIGIVGPGATSRAGFTLFDEQRARLDAQLPDARFQNATTLVDDLRLIKSDEELEVMRRAGEITDKTHEALFRLTHAGATPRAIRREIEALIAREGATAPFNHIGAISMQDPTGYYPDFYPTDQKIEPGSLVMTECCVGYGNYWGKLWGSFFVGEPTADYRRMFEAASKTLDGLVAGVKPGMTGREVDRFLEPIKAAGLVQPANILVGGWSAMNHAPAMGAMETSLSVRNTVAYADVALQPRQTVTLHAWVRIPETRKGLWVGSSGAITQTGFESFNRYPIGKLRVAR